MVGYCSSCPNLAYQMDIKCEDVPKTCLALFEKPWRLLQPYGTRSCALFSRHRSTNEEGVQSIYSSSGIKATGALWEKFLVRPTNNIQSCTDKTSNPRGQESWPEFLCQTARSRMRGFDQGGWTVGSDCTFADVEKISYRACQGYVCKSKILEQVKMTSRRYKTF